MGAWGAVWVTLLADPNIIATSYALLQGETTCWRCLAVTKVMAICVPGFIDNED